MDCYLVQMTDSVTLMAGHSEPRKETLIETDYWKVRHWEPLKAKDFCLVVLTVPPKVAQKVDCSKLECYFCLEQYWALPMDRSKVMGCYLEQRKAPAKEKDYCSEQRMEPLIATVCCWEPRKDSMTPMADHLGRWKDSMTAKDYCWEPRMDSLTMMADHLGRLKGLRNNLEHCLVPRDNMKAQHRRLWDNRDQSSPLPYTLDSIHTVDFHVLVTATPKGRKMDCC